MSVTQISFSTFGHLDQVKKTRTISRNIVQAAIFITDLKLNCQM